ncbi:RagB/SusD family nutrient uptake outer membrane protein, partial [Bacteroidota bacterium]
MKKIFLIVFSLLVLFSCKKDLLDIPDPKSVYEVWDNPQKASLYINDLYGRCLPSDFSGNSEKSDESPGGNNFMYGMVTPETESDIGHFSAATFRSIRYINIALEELESSNMKPKYIKLMKGQAYFLRAWTYWDRLVKYYGGVPLITNALNPYTEEIDVPRNTTKECIEQIVADLDSATANLPAEWYDNEYARVTRGSAMALKGRVLLFWASPQYNPNNELDRWQMAYDANKAALDTLDADGYDLHRKFEEIFLAEANEEAIFIAAYGGIDATHEWDWDTRPVYAGGSGLENHPTWNLVKAFPMENGLKITDPASGYDSSKYWEDRDPRFYETIAYNGCEWNFSGVNDNVLLNYIYYVKNEGTGQVEMDAEGQPVIGALEESFSSTGFFCKKGIDPDLSASDVTESKVDWIEIRMAEVMLNFAECANEIGNNTEALEQIYDLRKRVRIDEGANGTYGLDPNMGQDELREAIMTERQIELAFENKRYWDLRRRNAFVGDAYSVLQLNGTRRSANIMILDSAYNITNFQDSLRNGLIDLSRASEISKYFEAFIIEENDPINYPQPLYNFFPISFNVLEKAPNLQ